MFQSEDYIEIQIASDDGGHFTFRMVDADGDRAGGLNNEGVPEILGNSLAQAFNDNPNVAGDYRLGYVKHILPSEIIIYQES